jgi:hypothetical protein
VGTSYPGSTVVLILKSYLLLLSELCTLTMLSYSKNTFFTKPMQFLITFFLTLTTHCSIYVHKCSKMLLTCNMLPISLSFKSTLGHTWKMLSSYYYNLAKVHFYSIRFKYLQGTFTLANPFKCLVLSELFSTEIRVSVEKSTVKTFANFYSHCHMLLEI